MKNLIRLYRRWRYRRLYRKLFFLYAAKYHDASDAIEEADFAFRFFVRVAYLDVDDYIEVIRNE